MQIHKVSQLTMPTGDATQCKAAIPEMLESVLEHKICTKAKCNATYLICFENLKNSYICLELTKEAFLGGW